MSYEPPSHGWLKLTIFVNEQAIEIDASDVPNNPVEELLSALELVANGVPSCVWWHLEPDGYFMYFLPVADNIHLKIVFAPDSVSAQGTTIAEISDTPANVLLPFWRFVREFQTHNFREPHWPDTDFSRLLAVKDRIRL